MPPTEGKVWTTTRKVIGNVVPLVLASPVLVLALLEFARNGASVRLLTLLSAFLVVTWVMLALFGLVGNGSMKREVGRRLHIDRPFDKAEKLFVGFARPTYRSALDPHEDVGFLIFHEDSLEFYGAEHRIVILRDQVTGVRFRPNAHSLVFLGRWVSVEAVVGEKPVRLLVEPRFKWSLIANFLASRGLRNRVAAWKSEGPSAFAEGPSSSQTGPEGQVG